MVYCIDNETTELFSQLFQRASAGVTVNGMIRDICCYISFPNGAESLTITLILSPYGKLGHRGIFFVSNTIVEILMQHAWNMTDLPSAEFGSHHC